MKTMIVLFTSLIASVAFACPQISGTYTCTYSDGSMDTMTVEQSMENGVYVYAVDGDAFYMDGAQHPIQSDELVGHYVASCAGNSVSAQVTGDLINQGNKVGTIQALLSLTVGFNGVVQATTGTVEIGGQTYPLDDTANCVLN